MSGLFDDIERTEHRPAQYGEQSYHYLNLSARPAAGLIRDTLDVWFADYPDEHRENLKRDLIAKSDQSAFTELLVHQMLFRRGAADICIHPEIQGTEKRLDFRANVSGQDLYVEVRNSAETDNPRIQGFCDGVNAKCQTKGFMLDLSFEGDFDAPVSVGEFDSFVQKNAATLKLSELNRIINQDGPDRLPVWIFNHGTDRIHVTLVPCKEPDKLYDRPIGSLSPHDVYVLEHAKTLRRKLKKKASRYGVLNAPYVIVANFEDGFLEDIDIAQALFGDEVFIDYRNGKGLEFSRENNGLWAVDRNTRVSGVLIFNRVDPWSFWQRVPSLWLNPVAAHTLDRTFFDGWLKIHDVVPSTGRLIKTQGTDFAHILGLDEQAWTDTFYGGA